MLPCEPSCFVRIIIVHYSLCGCRRANIQGHNESSVMRCIHLTSNHHFANAHLFSLSSHLLGAVHFFAAWTPKNLMAVLVNFTVVYSQLQNLAFQIIGFWAFSIFFPCKETSILAMSRSSSDASIRSSPASIHGTRTDLAYHQHRSVPADRCSCEFEEFDISRWNRDVDIILYINIYIYIYIIIYNPFISFFNLFHGQHII